MSKVPIDREDRGREIEAGLPEVDLVKVAGAQNEAEAGFLQGLLLEEGVRSILRRSGGFDVPEFLAAGPRDVLVSASNEQIAREVLLAPESPVVARAAPVASPRHLLVGLLAVLALFAGIACIAADLNF